ncbi:MAG: ABC transporter substrate-binding protein [Prolixibacteraceae bacterium]|nr:ABC transporter substrate-binding protein [Prolixibacteraceae bacterium]
MGIIQNRNRPCKAVLISTKQKAKSLDVTKQVTQSYFFVCWNKKRNLSCLTVKYPSSYCIVTAESKNCHPLVVFNKNGLTLLNDIQFKPALRLLMIGLLMLISFSGFSQKVQKVVSLAPSITENIYLLDAQDKLVGCTSYCTQALADGVSKVGETVNVNVEKIFALQPDLVLTMQLTKPQDVEALKNLGIRVELIPTPKTFDEICEQTIRIGSLLGQENKAAAIIQSAHQIVDSLKEICFQTNKKPRIFFQIGANPIFTVLQNTFMDDFITICNGVNIADGMTKGTITRESVLVRNPDVIIVATMGGFGKKEKEIWSSYPGLKAAKNKHIFLIDSKIACSPTPVNFVKALKNVYQFVTQ